MGNNGNRSRINPKQMIGILVFLVYCVVALLAGYHTYEVFLLADPPFFAFLGAIAVDGMLALTLYLIGHWYGDQRLVGLVGVGLFAILSGGMQVIARKISLGEVLPDWLQFGADYAVPISVTLSLLVLGAIKYFDSDSNGVPDFMERGKNKGGNQNPYREVQSQYNGNESQHIQRQQIPGGMQGERLPLPGGAHIPVMSGKLGGNGNGRTFPNDMEPMPKLVDPRNPTPPA